MSKSFAIWKNHLIRNYSSENKYRDGRVINLLYMLSTAVSKGTGQTEASVRSEVYQNQLTEIRQSAKQLGQQNLSNYRSISNGYSLAA